MNLQVYIDHACNGSKPTVSEREKREISSHDRALVIENDRSVDVGASTEPETGLAAHAALHDKVLLWRLHHHRPTEKQDM